MNFDFDKTQRGEILQQLFKKLENYYANTKEWPVSPKLNLHNIRTLVQAIDLNEGINPSEAIDHITNALEEYAVHTPHPNYFGLFNPRPNFASILADIIAATYNPQLASWSHSPYAVEIEAHVIRAFAEKYGYNPDTSDGVFATGGAESNLTAVLCALNHRYPDYTQHGLFGIDEQPVILCSQEAHHSIQKAAKVVGLGYDSVKVIPTDGSLKMDIDLLAKHIEELLTTRTTPLMVVGTAGTTGTGTIDDLVSISRICDKYNVWFHADAAYGGAAIISKRLRDLLLGIEHADSITFDAHKWMSVPMGTSIFLTSHKSILSKTFRSTPEYMPKEASKMEIVDPFAHSIQWSRRFIGLKVYLSLIIYGWKGYEEVINHQTVMGDLLRTKLIEHGWQVKNSTALPVVCFSDPNYEHDLNFCSEIINTIISKGNAWVSAYPVHGMPIIRACITNYNTTKREIDELVAELNQARSFYEDNS